MAQTERANLDFDSFGTATKRAGTTTTITSDSNHNHNRGGGRQNRHSLLPFRHISSSSDEDGGSHRHGGRFHHSLKLLDRTARTRGQGSTCNAGVNDGGHGSWRGHGHAWSQTSQGSGSGSDAHSPSDSATSSPAMTKEEFEALPLTIQRKCVDDADRAWKRCE
ncbi:hypothetical protein ISF_00593 [Cordyceps fumosorosea ARSEF 2679]|uniref:Uncharacterized protein n=1 Tax=Cordyceps fumosorosea (strain ARSEF 2679) TaxID=1081104 RepID=A0A162JTT0_CORFA|nr:hypothetical protein ISF_00593 [Cordyceps fumosorosea ARSEF 2679]OAA73692.1 hypothetical protein ISF_00593 [Cordyceps fumosorosea ARSEF 2679]